MIDITVPDLSVSTEEESLNYKEVNEPFKNEEDSQHPENKPSVSEELRNLTMNNTNSGAPRARFPDVELFDGNRDEYQGWLLDLKSEIRRDGLSLGDNNQDFVDYGFGRLKGEAKKKLRPWIENNIDNPATYTFEAFTGQLNRMFEDTERVHRAISRLYAVRQGYKRFCNFLPDFEKLLLEAQATSWQHDTKLVLLQNALNKTTANRLRHRLPPTRYDDFCKELVIGTARCRF